MKDETIRPGDLVMVVKPIPCCGRGKNLGNVFIVEDIKSSDEGVCIYCRAKFPFQTHAGRTVGKMMLYAEISRLKKIHPPALPETVDAAQEVEA